MADIFSRILLNFKRRARARRFGLAFQTRTGFSRPDFLLINGVRHPLMLLDHSTLLSDFTEIFLDDEYHLEKLASRSVHFVLDIGANVGLFSLAAKIVFPNAMVHAYEPNPAVSKYLELNTKNLEVQCFAEAVGRDNGRASLVFSDKSTNLTRTLTHEDGSVLQISLQDAVRRMGGRVDLIKIDCEGTEWELFKDAEAWKNVTAITMEYHLWPGKPTIDDVKAKVSELGFEILRIKPLSGWTGMLSAVKR